MKKNDLIELQIEDLSTDGSGIGKWKDPQNQEGPAMAFFVKDALIGDRISAKITKLKKHYGFARIQKILEPSPYRTDPGCQLHRQCGGCQLQALSYEKQLEFKEHKIRSSLMRIGGFAPEEIPMEPMMGMDNAYRYRNKAQFPVGRDKEGKITAGFYAARTHHIIPVQDCCLGVPHNQEVMRRVLAWMERYGTAPYDEKTGTGLIRHVLVRFGFRTGQIMVCLVINGKSLKHPAPLIDSLTEIEGMTSISISVNENQSNVIMGDYVKTLWGKDYIEDYIGEIKFQISPLSFYQVNPVQTEKLYQTAFEYAGLTGKEIVWDLYCGIGTISLFFAQKARKVFGIEIVPQAVEDARRNAGINGIGNAEFFLGDAEEAEKMLSERPQIVVVDPPRKGCGEKLLKTIIKIQPERIVYISCDPATLARDLKYLCGEGGYVLRRVRGVDQFCQTVHVETIVLIQKKTS